MKMNVRELFKVVIGGLALRGAWATGLSATSPANAHNPRASGFPLLSLAEVLRISLAVLDWFIARTKSHVGVLHQHAHRMFYCCYTVFIRPSILSFSIYRSRPKNPK